ncbi:MAG: class I SAM-dependent methyltransferase [Alphaproteobacteria bacterium]|nr:class I SAM-dependent methyltransferase [Alphaproteobacteria bacterium]
MIKYSKPSTDVAIEFDAIFHQEEKLVALVESMNNELTAYPVREYCNLCENSLNMSEKFLHRSLPFYTCQICGHVQSMNMPDKKFHSHVAKRLGYDQIYQTPDEKAYSSRCERVYRPKWDWAHEVLKKLQRNAQKLQWHEIGCGSGYFLKCLKDAQVNNISGVDIDKSGIGVAKKFLGPEVKLWCNEDRFEESLSDVQADVYVAFFVLEHIDLLFKVADALARKPSGTIFIFSVPVMSFITLFESSISQHYPRNLDGMLHTQIFTDESIDYFIKRSGFEIASQWVFGQDIMDINRFLAFRLKDKYPEDLLRRMIKKMQNATDGMQTALDQNFFSDARHILAVKI